jgi:transcriptional regulator GlxA family with amidase domain
MGLKIDILATPLSSGSLLYGLYDTLSMPGAAWPRIVEGEARPPLAEVRIVTPSGEPTTCIGGIPVAPHAACDVNDYPDVICIPNVRVPPESDPRGIFPDEVAWIRGCFEKGSIVGTACSGSILLAEAGLLDGLEATSHWGFDEMFWKYYPEIDYRRGRTLMFAGDGQRIVMSGGMASWHSLSLYLIARFFGPEQAAQTARVYVMSELQTDQLAYSAMPRRIEKEDLAVGNCQEWAAQNYALADPVAAMAALSGVSRRTFTRRFKAATGYTPLEYVQSLRVEEAKQLLETTDHSIPQIAAAVGYNDERAFRRLFAKRTGLTAADYRRRFDRSRFLQTR